MIKNKSQEEQDDAMKRLLLIPVSVSALFIIPL